MRQRIIVVAIAVVTLIAAAVWARAQALPSNALEPMVVSGADVGFRVDRWQGDTLIGRWVIRHDGKWVEPRTSAGTHRVITR